MNNYFLCQHENKKDKQTWSAQITSLYNYGSHYEMRIESLSGITVLFGKTSMGTFACMPDFSAGCHLAELDNESYSKQKLLNVINPVDAITIARALKVATKGGVKNYV